MLNVIRSGTTYPLDDGTYSLFLGDDGWGMAPTNRINSRGPLQHGVTDLGFRLAPRVATLFLFIQGFSRQDLYDKRDALLRLFSADNSPVQILWSLDEDRQIDAHFMRGMDMGSGSRPGFNQRLAITFQCPDPTFYDPASKGLTFALGGGSDSLTIPLAVPMFVGASTLDSLTPITYNGSWRTYPHLIRITGPITNAIITNETTGEKLDFTGLTIAGGEYYDIDLRYGIKTVTEDDGTNRIDKLTDDSDLASWHIAADPEALGGANSIRVTGSSVTESTSVEISYFERFIGR